LIHSEYKIYNRPFLCLVHDMSIAFTATVTSLCLQKCFTTR